MIYIKYDILDIFNLVTMISNLLFSRKDFLYFVFDNKLFCQ